MLSVRRAGLVLTAIAVVFASALGLLVRRARSSAHPSRREIPVAPRDAVGEARDRLARFEAEQRARTDFLHLPPALLTHGSEPYALARLDPGHLVGVLRGASAAVLLDSELRELQRIELPAGATAITVDGSGACWIASERSATLHRFRLLSGELRQAGALHVPGIVGIRALTAGPSGVLYALDVEDGKLLTLRSERSAHPLLEARSVGHGPLSLRRVGSALLVDVLLDHTLVVYRTSETGQIVREQARIHHDGPIWGFDAARSSDGGLLIALTGVEDHPLVRSEQGFGYIDSFAFVYLVSQSGELRESWRQNVSELGVVTPKAPILRLLGKSAEVFISGYGSDRALRIEFEPDSPGPTLLRSERFYPGSSAALRLDSGAMVFADPLLDAWLLRPATTTDSAEVVPRLVAVPGGSRGSREERLGEALFFTTLMAPANSSTGAHSRFTCETCHYEGYVDGRVHYTGRADVSVATKPLRGLFNNRPHFSRALDADLATVSHHEFRVAGQGSGADPWFAIEAKEYPWLAALGALDTAEQVLGPELLRRSLIAFLMRFSHETNPNVVGRSEFDDRERHGAELFREHCASCHSPRLQSDDPASALPFAAWERAIFSAEGAIVWASADYQKTGVTPYVHELGTRVPSLRRVFSKWPHFTNGSADTLLDVVSRARFGKDGFWHARKSEQADESGFSDAQQRQLAAFLELL